MKAVNFRRFFVLLFTIFNVMTAQHTKADEGASPMSMSLKSADFVHQGEIPQQFTCQGDDSSPSLAWSGVPAKAKSLVLIVDDLDAPDPSNPKMTWVHWVLYNITPTISELPRQQVARLDSAREKRLETHRLRWPLSADGQASLLSQAVRFRHRTA